MSVEDEPPTYQRLLALLQSVPGSKASRSWVERVLSPDWLPGSEVPSDADPLQAGLATPTPSADSADAHHQTGVAHFHPGPHSSEMQCALGHCAATCQPAPPCPAPTPLPRGYDRNG